MNTKAIFRTITIMLILFGMAACKKEPPVVLPATYHITAIINDSKETYSEDVTDHPMVSIKGLGKATEMSKMELSILPSEGYTLEGVYFSYGQGIYDPTVFPTTANNAIKDEKIKVTVKGDLTLHIAIAKVDDQETTEPEQPEEPKDPEVEKPTEEPIAIYSHTEHVDEAYWREQNRKAYDMVVPRITTLNSEEEYWEYMWEAWPSLGDALPSDTIYTREDNMIGFELQYGKEYTSLGFSAMPDRAIRIAYGLADMSGNIVEVYPPVWWDHTAGQVNTTVFVTVPEGQYIRKLFINHPDRRDVWIDMPNQEWSYFGVDPKFKIEYSPWGYKEDDHKLQKHLFHDEKSRIANVISRDSQDKLPIPRWTNLKVYQKGKRKLYNEGATVGVSLEETKPYSYHVDIVNRANVPMKGKVYLIYKYNHWFTAHVDIAREYEAYILKTKYRNVGNLAPVSFDNVFKVRGVQSVNLKADGGTQTILFQLDRCFSNRGNSWAGNPIIELIFLISMGDEYFYFQPEGTTELYPLHQDQAEILNKVQKSGIAWDAWWVKAKLWRTDIPRFENANTPYSIYKDSYKEYSNGIRIN